MSWEIDTESHRALVFCAAAPRIPRMPRIPRRPWSNSCVTRPRAWPIACRRRSSSCMRTGFPQHFNHYFGKWSTNGWNGLADFLTNTCWLAEIHVFFVGFADFLWRWPFQKMSRDGRSCNTSRKAWTGRWRGSRSNGAHLCERQS